MLLKEERKIKLRIDKTVKRLRCLEDIRDRIEKLMQRYLHETRDIEKRIADADKLIESLLHAQTVAVNKRKIHEEILRLNGLHFDKLRIKAAVFQNTDLLKCVNL